MLGLHVPVLLMFSIVHLKKHMRKPQTIMLIFASREHVPGKMKALDLWC